MHTQHPLELTDVLQGFDIPLSLSRGPDAWEGLADVYDMSKPLRIANSDDSSRRGGGEEKARCGSLVGNGTYCEFWEDMLPDVGRFFEWCVAHRLNRVEWILLGNRKWGPIVESTLRHRRLAVMARMGQSMGLMVGVDDPIAFQQQHSWVMTTTLGPVRQQLKAVRDRVDWILSAGFDFLSTESGLSEFSHPNDQLMLRLLNQVGREGGTTTNENLNSEAREHDWGCTTAVRVALTPMCGCGAVRRARERHVGQGGDGEGALQHQADLQELCGPAHRTAPQLQLPPHLRHAAAGRAATYRAGE